jgi:hypothetical protein
MDRIAEIKRHLSIAEGDERTVSAHRWEAARLIWEEIEEGKSRRELAREIGKSHTHVRYMYNCWDLVGRKLVVSGGSDALPNFQAVYMSDEIRFPEDDEHKAQERHQRQREREQEDHTAHGLVMRAANAVDSLARNSAYWPLLTDDDWDVLRAIPPTIRALIRESAP